MITSRFGALALFLALATSSAGAQLATDDPRGAVRYMRDLRAYPFDRIPPQARSSAMAQMRARWPRAFVSRDALAIGAPTSSTTWTPLGPAPLTSGISANSGRLNAIAIHPTDSLTIYVGAAQGGVWKTTDGGVSWKALTDGQCSLAMGAVAIDPVNPQIVYAGTGEQNFSGDSYYGCGVLRSIDGGATWTQLGASIFDTATGGATISRIVIDKVTAGSTSGTTLLAATNFGLYRSTNSGVTWLSVQAGTATELLVDPATPSVMYAAIGNPSGSAANGVYKSLNTGATWTLLAGGFPTTNVGRINLAIAPSAPGTLYAAVQNGQNPQGSTFGALLGIWVTNDGGATWTKTVAATASCGGNQQCWYDMTLAVDPTTPTTVYFGGLSLYKSVDGGLSFRDILATALQAHSDQHFLLFSNGSPATLFVGNDGGIFKSLDAGTTWASLNTNLAITQFYAGTSIDPASATTFLGGTQDNGTLQWGGALTWPAVLGGDGGYTAIDPTAAGVAYGETQWSQGTASSGPRRRDAAGSGFLVRNFGINVNDRATFIAPIAMDPFRPRVLFFGTFRLYRTGNRGDLWTAISPDLSRGNGTINAIGVAPSDSNTAYVGTTDANVQYTHDLGVTWKLATGLPTAAVSDFAVDPHDARVAYVTFHGFTAGKIFRTLDGGATWTDLTFNLPNIPVLSIVLEPGRQDLDVGTDLGVFTLRSGTTAWVPITNGLPNVAVYDLIYDATRSRLLAATHGRGVFSLDVTVTGLRGDITNDGVIGAVDAQAILSAVVGLPLPAGAIRFPNGDANCDGDVTAADALVVLSKVAGLNVSTQCVGTIK